MLVLFSAPSAVLPDCRTAQGPLTAIPQRPASRVRARVEGRGRRSCRRSPVQASGPHCNDGFTLIELLVVVIILGVLSAIAVPVYLTQRAKGYDASIKADLKGAAQAVEAWQVDNPQDTDGPGTLTNYAAASDTLATSITVGTQTIKISPGNFIRVFPNATGQGYCIAAANASATKKWVRPGDPTAATASIYDSTTGGVTSSPSSGCALSGYTAGTGTLPCPRGTLQLSYLAISPPQWRFRMTFTPVPGATRHTTIFTGPSGGFNGTLTAPTVTGTFQEPDAVVGEAGTVTVSASNNTTGATSNGCTPIQIVIPSPADGTVLYTF